jgi:uncharacterized protein YjbI with pentapeptide repeats
MLHYRSDLTKLMKMEKSTDSTNEKWNCLSCSKVFSTEKSLIYHLISTHKAIAEHIPAKDSKEIQRPAKHQKVQIVFKRKKKLALKKNIQSDLPKINVSDESSSNEEDFNPEKAGTSKSISSKPKIKVSDETSSDEDDLNQEKDGSSQKISSKQNVDEKDEFRCNVCNGKNSNKRNLLRHMALIHFRQELLKMFKKTQINKSQNDLSQYDLVQINKSQNDISQINKNQNDLSQNDLSQDDISQNDLSQDDLYQDDLSQNDLSINSDCQINKIQNDKTQNECGLCGRNFGDENYLLCHIANVHKGLEKLISAQTSQN